MRANFLPTALLALISAVGCTSMPADRGAGFGYAMPKQVDICHGYSCAFRSKLDLGVKDGQRFRAILLKGAASPGAERVAISRAVQYFEERSYQSTGVRDLPKAEFGAARIKGQMDCVDESTNTRTLLAYLEERGLLKHHKVENNASRGFLIDGRYPHWTAVVRDPAGVRWAVDSWYAPMSGAPDIIPMTEWTPRGYLSSGALDS
jgi:hypothetical protein